MPFNFLAGKILQAAATPSKIGKTINLAILGLTKCQKIDTYLQAHSCLESVPYACQIQPQSACLKKIIHKFIFHNNSVIC